MMTSINVLDCLPVPMQHLHSLGTLVAPDGSVLLSTPFDWSPNASPVEAWIGGHGQRSNEVGGSVRRGWSDFFVARMVFRATDGVSVAKRTSRGRYRIHARNRVEYLTRLLVLTR